MDSEDSCCLARLADGELREKALLWLSCDKNPRTLEEAKHLLAEKSECELKELFCRKLKFGTAGLRAPMGAGYSRLNDLTIQQASQGFCVYLLNRHGQMECRDRGIVVARDNRHNSEQFANLAAATFLSRGFRVYLFGQPVHTPLVSFALLHLKCVAGIMVTASHNPKEYNGYKVYDSNGVQIIPPVDAHVAQAIDQNQMLWPEVEEFFNRETRLCRSFPGDADLLQDPRESIVEAYMSAVSRDLCMRRKETAQSNLKVVYTPLHGVGLPFATELLARFGFSKGLLPVEAQCDMDPNFSTVPFPNPEEKGALDLALQKATEADANIIIANDPDADRFACAEKCHGSWHQFTGDEVGIILAAYLADTRAAQETAKQKMLFVTSMVSSKMLKAFAEANGCAFEETPTGLKWMGNKAAELEASRGLLPVLVYEEALGYAACPLVRDKDGVSAAAVLVELACLLYAKGSTLSSYLASLRARYGYFITNNGYKLAQPPQQQKALAWLYNGGQYHPTFGSFRVESVRNIAMGTDSATPDGRCLFSKEAGDMITLRFHNGAVVSLRPSGTEPKLKWYAEICSTEGDAEARKNELEELVQEVVKALPFDA
ncbi:phosphoglucomutase-2 [Cyclospora cayetanensis]|uniref:Phosphoglucomutase-2 n=1 Tax=Cyclospora cayetanensis TaxID=88456 RepID=A0A6P6S374_9EIME|nr:phosphoglucomutase-2 [Cyclospora cayetanensis]